MFLSSVYLSVARQVLLLGTTMDRGWSFDVFATTLCCGLSERLAQLAFVLIVCQEWIELNRRGLSGQSELWPRAIVRAVEISV